MLLEEENGDFSEMTTLCDGSDSSILIQLYCLIPMSTFRDTPFNKVQGDAIKAKVLAYNERGWSLVSSETVTSSVIEVEPHQITDFSNGDQTSHQQVHVQWTAPDDGGSPILSYVLHWDQGLGSDFVELAGETSQLTQTEFTITNGITVGETYKLKVKAVNK